MKENWGSKGIKAVIKVFPERMKSQDEMVALQCPTKSSEMSQYLFISKSYKYLKKGFQLYFMTPISLLITKADKDVTEKENYRPFVFDEQKHNIFANYFTKIIH